MQKKLSLLFIIISLSTISPPPVAFFHNELKAQNDSYFNIMSTDREENAGGINFGEYIYDYSNGGVSFNDFGYGGEAYVPLGNAFLLLSGAGISYALYKRKRNNNK